MVIKLSVKACKYKLHVLALLLITLFFSRLEAQVYNQVIYIPSDSLDKEVQESVTDMAYWLEKIAGKQVYIKNNKPENLANGISIQLINNATISPGIKKQISQDGQSFYLVINGVRSAQIIGTGKNSLINGIYTFLQELGFRWYMPGDNWVIIPDQNQLKSINVKKVYSPDFENRSYGGTGGMANIKGLDAPANSFWKDFTVWNRRNRFGSDYDMKGHMGMAFYTANKNELNAHPEYFCDGKVNPFGRIDISNPAAVNLYIDWALKQANSNNRFSLIGVEPADGSGGKDDCLPANMLQIKSWSDKYFWLANQVAEKAENKKINALVELYAYNDHVAPPEFELHKKVYPVIIPYAFQNITDPERFIELWHKKMNRSPMGVYDYWNITQWSVDAPQFNIYSIPKKLKSWKKNNITTINLESTNAKGPMGHALWLASQMMWNTNLSFDSLYHQFLQQCFGPAAPEIKRMYDRWSLSFQGGMDVFLSLKDLNAAASKTSDPLILNRIAELKAYVHYVKLYYDYLTQPTVAGYKELIEYIYRIHYLRLVQTFPLQAYYIKPPASFDKQAYVKALLSDSARIAPMPLDAIGRKANQDLAENPITYTSSKLQFDVAKAHPVQKDGLQNPNLKYLNGRNNYFFYIAKEQKIKIQAGATAPTKLTIKDEQENIRFEKEIAGTKDQYETILVDLPAGKYTLSYGDLYRFSRIIFPADIVFFTDSRWYDNAGYPLIYVYVPKDVSEIVYVDKLGPGVNRRGDWIDPEGRHIKPEPIKYFTYRVPVPPQDRAKVWVLNIGHRSFWMLNIPNILSLNNFEYKE